MKLRVTAVTGRHACGPLLASGGGALRHVKARVLFRREAERLLHTEVLTYALLHG